jgi:hypothetical protein
VKGSEATLQAETSLFQRKATEPYALPPLN